LLKLRGLVKRVLVVTPKGITTQWVQEMKTHFNEEFQLLSPGEFSLWRNLTGSENVWRHFDQVVCPIDAIKPVEKRRGWAREKIEAHNQERLGDLIAAGWDLIICASAYGPRPNGKGNWSSTTCTPGIASGSNGSRTRVSMRSRCAGTL